MRATVKLGDTYQLGTRQMRVVEIQHGTQAGGLVSFETAPVTAHVYLLPDRPLLVSSDQLLACYLLQATDNSTLYAVGVYDPTLGERIEPATAAPAPLSVDLVMCWAPGDVRVLIDGEPAAGETVSLLLERYTPDGVSSCLLPDKYKILRWSDEWQALVDSGLRDAPYKTDENGYVYNAALYEPLMFPRGHGAFGQRYDDRLYEGCVEAPEEYTGRVWLYFRGQRVELVEDEPATLDWRTGTIEVTAPAGCWVRAELEQVGQDPTSVTCRVAAQVPQSGLLTLTGLYPGRYCLSAWQPGSGTDSRDWSQIARRQWVSVAAGETASTTVEFETAPSGYYLMYVYTCGADSQAGIEVLGLVPPGGYTVLGTTDASGRVLVSTSPPPANLLINDPYWGYQQLRGDGPTFEATLGGYVVLALSLGFGGEGGWWAFPGEGHEHLDAYVPPGWQVRVEDTGETFDLQTIPIGARTTVPVPSLPPGEVDGWSFTAPEATYHITLLDPDGTFVRDLQNPQTPVRDGTDASLLLLEPLGGRAWGDVLAHSPSSPTDPSLPEAVRLGLEHGTLAPVVVQRYLREGQQAVEGRVGWVCPYCLSMTLIWPGPSRGYCPQCGSDGRSYLHGPPVNDGRWRLRHVLFGPNRRRQEVLCDHWYRPLKYGETDEYQAMYLGLPRWVCRHPVLGEWTSGLWSEGTDAAELEEEFCWSDERLLVRPKLEIVGQIVGDATYRLRYRTDGGELKHLDFTLRAGDEGIKLLSTLAPVWAEQRPAEELLFVRRVTSVSLLAPASDPGNHFRVVGDVPSLILQRLRISTAWATPLALQLTPLTLASGPDLRKTPDGRVFVAYVQDGDIYVAQRPSPQRPWGAPVKVTDGAHYTDPSITILPTGTILLAYTDATDGTQYLLASYDDGATWQAAG